MMSGRFSLLMKYVIEGLLPTLVLSGALWVTFLYLHWRPNQRLIQGVEQHNFLLVKQALKEGANPNLLDRFQGSHPTSSLRFVQWFQRLCYGHVLYSDGPPLLVEAVKSDDLATTSALLKAGANPNVVYRHFTPLQMVVTEPFVDVRLVKVLLEGGADPNGRNIEFSPLIVALTRGPRLGVSMEVLHLLLDYGANPNVEFSGEPLLMYVITSSTGVPYTEREGARLVEWMLSHDARTEVHDMAGYTPLIQAIQMQNVPVIKVLLEHSANVRVTTPLGINAFNAAEATGNAVIVDLIEHYMQARKRSTRSATVL
jgi:ankyrin repeat protein